MKGLMMNCIQTVKNYIKIQLLVKQFKQFAIDNWFLYSDDRQTQLNKTLNIFNFKEYYNEVKSWKDDQTIPLKWRLYWCFKKHCDVNKEAFEDIVLYKYIDAIEQNKFFPLPEILEQQRDQILNKNKILNYITTSKAINEYKDKWKYSISINFYEKLSLWNSDDIKKSIDLKNSCFNWCINNVKGKFCFYEFSYTVEVGFTDKTDAMAFRLRWSDFDLFVDEKHHEKPY